MCYNISLLNPGEFGQRYGPILRFDEYYEDDPIYYQNAFTLPNHPVIPNMEPRQIQTYTWGLIPFWVKNELDAEKIRMRTMNARAETIFEKPSYRNAIQHKRCLVPADGFFEWRYYQGKNYPYYIHLKDHEIFSLAGIWETWENTRTNETEHTFSIITCEANPLLRKIHNKKKRMPVILPKNIEMDYLNNDLTQKEIQHMFIPYEQEQLKAYTISRLVTSNTRNRNVPEVIEPYKYPELPTL